MRANYEEMNEGVKMWDRSWDNFNKISKLKKMRIKDIAKEIHQTNIDKGFWEDEKNVGELLMLVVSELSEALEADRKGRRANYEGIWMVNKDEIEWFQENIKDTFEDEIADSVIRLLDLSEGLGIDIESHIRLKLEYNKTRPYKHGKKY